jgi:hypothetical protein
MKLAAVAKTKAHRSPFQKKAGGKYFFPKHFFVAMVRFPQIILTLWL